MQSYCSYSNQPEHKPSFYVTRVDTFYDCLVIACLRRLQEWSYVSILAEFRQHTWPHKLHDFEQVIEKFNTALVELPVNVPEFLSIHDNFKVGIDCSVIYSSYLFTDDPIVFSTLCHRKRSTSCSIN